MKSLLIASLAASLVAATTPAFAQDGQGGQDEELRYLLGASVAVGPAYDGASKFAARIRPVWAVKFGRVRIASGGGSALLGFGRGGAGPGASTELVQTSRWRVGVSLRVDSGRDSGDAETTRGLPDVKRTLRARLYANCSLTPDWNLGGALSQDALGRGGGMTGGLGLDWRFHRSASAEWTTSVGLSAGNAQHMRAYFGVPEAAATPGRPAYRPGAGLREAYLSLGARHALDKHWFVFGSAGVSHLLGPAADSPLVQKPTSPSVAVGLAWRN